MRFFNQPHAFYCGVDLHARTMHVCVLDQEGQVLAMSEHQVEPPAQEGGPPGQLYHLDSDPSETRNVYADHPEIVRRLSARLKAIQGADL